MRLLFGIVEFSPQTLFSSEDIKDYERVCEMYDNCDYDGIFNYAMQWEYWENTSLTYDYIDTYEETLVETATHILTVCPSKHFGHQGNAFFLYRKEY